MLFGRLKWLSASRFASSVSGLWTKARRGGRAIGNLVSRVFATGNVNMMAWLTETQLSEGLMFASIDVHCVHQESGDGWMPDVRLDVLFSRFCATDEMLFTLVDLCLIA
jgi:hypothetical protein